MEKLDNVKNLENIEENTRFYRFWNYFKYQVFTKIIIAVIFLPIFRVFRQYMLSSTGRTNLSSGDYLGFLFSIQGLIFVFVGFIFLSFIIGMDFNAIIVISYYMNTKNGNVSVFKILEIVFKSVKKFINPLGLFVVFYIALIMPLLSIGIESGPFKSLAVPNFIMSVVKNNTTYLMIYTVVIILLTVIVFFYSFSIHYLLLNDENIKNSLKKSFVCVKKNYKNFIKEILKYNFKFILYLGLSILIILGIIYFPSKFMDLNLVQMRAYLIFIFSLCAIGVSFLVFMTMPIQMDLITRLFIRYEKIEGRELLDLQKIFNIKERKIKKQKISTKFGIIISVLLLLLGNLVISIILGIYFDEVFKNDIEVNIIAHRAGGDLGAENSVEGLKGAIKEGAKFSEIDVQRTKDGYYIINHDKNFKRLSGESRSSSEMTLEEIKSLKVKNEFNPNANPTDVATLEEFMEESKDKIGLFIELKGSTADEKMVDDVVKMIKERNMEKETVILSLDYKIIQYTEKNYPEIDTGFLYFFSFGSAEKLEGDYLIMEEREATDENIEKIKSEGKKVVVWTVNTQESINKFINKKLDGIITDYILSVKKAVEDRKNKSDLEIITDFIFED